MNDTDLRRRIAKLESRNTFLLIVVIGIGCGFVADLASRELGMRSIKARGLTLKSESGFGMYGPSTISLRSKPNLTQRHIENLNLTTHSIQMLVNIDDNLGSERLVEISANDDNLEPFPHVYLYRAEPQNSIAIAIGSLRLVREESDGKKIETELPASSLVFFDEEGKSRKLLP